MRAAEILDLVASCLLALNAIGLAYNAVLLRRGERLTREWFALEQRRRDAVLRMGRAIPLEADVPPLWRDQDGALRSDFPDGGQVPAGGTKAQRPPGAGSLDV